MVGDGACIVPVSTLCVCCFVMFYTSAEVDFFSSFYSEPIRIFCFLWLIPESSASGTGESWCWVLNELLMWVYLGCVPTGARIGLNSQHQGDQMESNHDHTFGFYAPAGGGIPSFKHSEACLLCWDVAIVTEANNLWDHGNRDFRSCSECWNLRNQSSATLITSETRKPRV